MAELRQTPFQTQQLSGQTVFDQGIETNAQKIAGQLQDLLTNGVNDVERSLAAKQQMLERKNTQMTALANLVDATKDMQNKKEIVTAENAVQAHHMEQAQISQDLSIAESKFSDTLALEKQGMTAYIANHSPAELKNLIDNGQGQAIDPMGYLELEKQTGIRLAMQDVPAILAAIHQKGPDQPTEKIVQAAVDRINFDSPRARAAYLERLTGDINSFNNSELLNLMDQTRVKNTENLSNVLATDIAKDVTDPTIAPQDLPMKFLSHIRDFQKSFAELNPRTASDQDILLATTNAFKTVIGSGALSKMAPERLVPMFNGVQGVLEHDPRFLPLLGAIGNDIRQQVGAVYAQRGKVISDQISSATDQLSLQSAGLLMKNELEKGHIDPNMLPEWNKAYQDKQLQLKDRINAEARVYQKPGFANTPLEDTSHQDEQIDVVMRRYFMDHPVTDGSGNPRDPTQSEYLTTMFQRTGRITRSSIDALNTAMSIPQTKDTTPQQSQAYMDASQSVASLLKIAPVYLKSLSDQGKINNKMFVMNSLLSNTDNHSVGATALALADMGDHDLQAARAALAARIKSDTGKDVNAQFLDKQDLKDTVGDIEKVAGNWFSNGASKSKMLSAVTFSADVVSERAEDGFLASFMKTYVAASKDGKDQATATDTAMSAAYQSIQSKFKVFDAGTWFGNNRYIVPNDFPLIADVQGSPQVAKQRFSRMGEAFMDQKWGAFSGYREKGMVGPFARPSNIPLTMDIDRTTVEGSGKNAMMVIPLKFNGERLDTSKPDNVFRYPLDPDAQKKLIDDKEKIRNDAIKKLNKNNPLGI